MNDNRHTTQLPEQASPSEERVDQSRRQLTKAGLGGSAVLLTLASRSVLGATCLTPSMAGSGNHSQHKGVPCTPHTPDYWVANQGSWIGFATNTAFHSLNTGFITGPFLNMGAKTLLQVLQDPAGTTPSDIAKWFVAGLLNATNGDYVGMLNAVGPDPSVTGLENEYATSGVYKPYAGHPGWNAAQIVAYLQDPSSVF